MKYFNENLIKINKKKFILFTYRSIFRTIQNGYIPIDNDTKNDIIREIKTQLSYLFIKFLDHIKIKVKLRPFTFIFI